MAINSRTLSSVQSDVTSLTTNETDFRDGLDDVMIQVNATEVKLSEVSTADLTKLNDVTASADEINTLTGISSTVQELNQLHNVTITSGVLNTLAGYTGDTDELNILDGITATQAEINKLAGYTGTYVDLNKIASVTASATDLNVLDGFAAAPYNGTLGDLVRCIELDAAGDGTANQVLTSDGDGTYSWTTPSSFTFTLEDEDGTEISIDTDEIKVVGYTTTDDGQGNITTTDGGIDINWGPGDGTDGNPYLLEIINTDKGSDVNAFKNIAVSGQTTIAADSDTDTLTIAAGTGISLATNATTDTLTITGTAAANNATITISGDVTADSTFTVDQSSNATITLSLDAGVVDTAELADGSVTSDKLANGVVTSAKIANGAILAEDLANDSVIEARIANFAVTGNKLANDRRRTSSIDIVRSGTTGDYVKYDPSGWGEISWYVNATEQMTLNSSGTLSATSFTAGSDPRLKNNITKVDNALDKINKLNGYTFTYKKNDMPSAGILTTELKEVLPSAVSVSNTDEAYEQADYNQMSALFIEAIKELKAEIEDLKSKIK